MYWFRSRLRYRLRGGRRGWNRLRRGLRSGGRLCRRRSRSGRRNPDRRLSRFRYKGFSEIGHLPYAVAKSQIIPVASRKEAFVFYIYNGSSIQF